MVRFDSFETEYHKPKSGYCRIRVKKYDNSEVYMYCDLPYSRQLSVTGIITLPAIVFRLHDHN